MNYTCKDKVISCSDTGNTVHTKKCINCCLYIKLCLYASEQQNSDSWNEMFETDTCIYISGVRGLPCWKIYVLLLMYIIFFNFMGVPKFKGNRFMFPRIFHLSPISAVIRNFLCQWLDILSTKKNCCRLSQELFLVDMCRGVVYLYVWKGISTHI